MPIRRLRVVYVMWHVDMAAAVNYVTACLLSNPPCVTPSKGLHKPKSHAGAKTPEWRKNSL